MRKLQNRLSELAAQKGRREGRTISQRDLAAETGLPLATVARWHRNEVSRFDEHIVLTLTNYFGVSIGELLIIEDYGGDSTPKAKPHYAPDIVAA